MVATDVVPSHDLLQGDARLDGAYYCSAGAAARRTLASSGHHLEHLVDLCAADGLYIPHRFKRPYVRDKDHGIPYITGSAIGLADPLQCCDYLSSRPGMVPHRERLEIRPGTVLVTCSGETGNAVFVNELFAGALGSPDLLRIMPNVRRIQAGYLYAFLASSLGRGLLTQGTYGGVIPHIEVSHVVDIPVPRLPSAIEQAVHERIEESAANQVEANRLLDRARERVYEATNLPRSFSTPYDHGFAVGSVPASLLHYDPFRLDSYYYVGYAGEARAWTSDKCSMRTLGEVVRRVFNPPIFKRVRVQQGIPYLLGAEVYQAHPRPATHLAPWTPNLQDYLLQRDTLVFEDAGQRYGLLGTPAYIGRTLAGNAATNNMTRIVPYTPDDAAYLFALLRTDFGSRLIVRQSYGTSLPHILPRQVEQVLIPWPEPMIRSSVADPVREAIALRDDANDLEDEAQAILSHALRAASRSTGPERS